MNIDDRWAELLRLPTQTPGSFQSLAAPTFRASTVVFKDAASLRQRDWRQRANYSYGLLGTPTTQALEDKLALLEDAKHAVLVPSGLAAISLILLSLVPSGDRVLLPDNIYDPARTLAYHLRDAYGIEVGLYDPLRIDTIEFTANTRLLWVETPGSITLEVADLPALSETAHAHGAVVAADTTWSAGIALPAFDLGADISLQALTKYQSGGSDLLMGSVVFRDPALYHKVHDVHTILGMGVSVEDCQTLLRSLPHYRLRYEAQDRNTRELADWLAVQPGIQRVLHPARPDSPGHGIWSRDFSGAASLLTLVFESSVSVVQIDAFLDRLQRFHLGFGWGGSVSLAAPYDLRRLRRDWQDNPNVVRLYIGLEPVDCLQDDLRQALEACRA
ncbi:MAG: PLP-dependent transferase [Burkholderiaceae bacterium]|jgi:cystathionine beta-lyase